MPAFYNKSFSLSDINECNSNPCHANAECTNIDGSFGCHCKQGYEGSGYLCSGTSFHFNIMMHNYVNRFPKCNFLKKFCLTGNELRIRLYARLHSRVIISC